MIVSCGQRFGDGLAKGAAGMMGPSGWWQCWEETTICILAMLSCCYLHNTSACGRLQSRQEEQPFSKKRVRSDGAGVLWGTVLLWGPHLVAGWPGSTFRSPREVLFCWRLGFLI